jgi:hypothetical protein
MKVGIHLKETSQVIVHEAKNAYQKGSFYCVYVDNFVYKYPIADIWRIKEDYNNQQPKMSLIKE